MTPVWAAVATALGVIGAGWLTFLASRSRQSSEDIAQLRAEIQLLQKQQRIQADYIGQLRRHIYEASPAPPPPWPADLIR